jgi:hypothetical protein
MALRPIDLLEGTAVLTADGRCGVVRSVRFTTGGLMVPTEVQVRLEDGAVVVCAPNDLRAAIGGSRVADHLRRSA